MKYELTPNPVQVRTLVKRDLKVEAATTVSNVPLAEKFRNKTFKYSISDFKNKISPPSSPQRFAYLNRKNGVDDSLQSELNQIAGKGSDCCSTNPYYVFNQKTNSGMKKAKNPRRRSETILTQSKLDLSIGTSIAKTPTKKPIGHRRKSTGQNDNCLIERDKHSPSRAQAFSEPPVIGSCLPEDRDCSTHKQVTQQALQFPAKIKLQLFPIDLSTQNALEKGGYNPHLELTLSKQKKIASVVRHLKSKWGTIYSVGEVMLFPYKIELGNLACYKRWTSEDTDITTGDVHEAIGCPAIFRLRYGWFSNVEPKIKHEPLAPSRFEDSMQNGSIKKGGSRDDEIAELGKEPGEIVGMESSPIPASDAPNVSQVEDIQADAANEPLDNPRTDQGLEASSSVWTDTQTDISLGALLSDTSLHAASYQTDPVAAKSDPYSQQIPFTCDSFDAAIAAHIYHHSQNLQRVALQSSFWDAEVTCDAFTSERFASSAKVGTSKGVPASCIQQVNMPAGVTQSQSVQEMKTGPPTRNTENNCVSSSHGATGVKWNDPLGLFDLSLSSSCRLLGGDSISLGGLLANSVDAFQDLNVPPT